MSDYDHCDKHKITYLVPEIIECPMCYLEQLERRAAGKVTPGLCLNDYDRDMLHETIEHFKRQQAELFEARQKIQNLDFRHTQDQCIIKNAEAENGRLRWESSYLFDRKYMRCIENKRYHETWVKCSKTEKDAHEIFIRKRNPNVPST